MPSAWPSKSNSWPHHALRGEVWEKVLLCPRRGGTKALARSANREAVAYFEQALGALTHLPDGREGRREQAIDHA